MLLQSDRKTSELNVLYLLLQRKVIQKGDAKGIG